MIKSFNVERVSNFRNAIAHYSFKIEVSTSDAYKDPRFQAAAVKRGEAFIKEMFERTCELLDLGNTVKLPHVPDPTATRIRYEEQVGKPLNKNSRIRTFIEARELISRVETLGFSMLFALVERGSELVAKSEIKSYGCPCGDGTLVVLSAAKEAICPACGAVGPV